MPSKVRQDNFELGLRKSAKYYRNNMPSEVRQKMRKNYILFSAKGAKKVVLNIVGSGHVPLAPHSPLDPQLQSQFVEIPRTFHVRSIKSKSPSQQQRGVYN